LRNLPNDITEDDIYPVMLKFGGVVKVKIPFEEVRGRRRNRGFAFVTFESIESAQRAIEQGEVTVDFATLEVEKALKRAPMPQRDKVFHEFEQLKRR